MSPKAKEFYNKLLSFYLDDNSVYTEVQNSYKDFLNKLKGKPTLDAFTKIGRLKDEKLVLIEYFKQLSDAEISEVMKTFKMRMFSAPESQVVFNNGAVVSAPTNKNKIPFGKLQPYQQSIVNSLLK